MISMTLPQSRRKEVSVNGLVVKLTPTEHKVVELLVLRGPGIVTKAEVIDYLWPNPDFEPDWALSIVRVIVGRARHRGVPIETHRSRGYSLPWDAQMKWAA